MNYEYIIEELEEYLNDNMYFYVEPPLGKEECELFIKLLKEKIEKGERE